MEKGDFPYQAPYEEYSSVRLLDLSGDILTKKRIAKKQQVRRLEDAPLYILTPIFSQGKFVGNLMYPETDRLLTQRDQLFVPPSIMQI